MNRALPNELHERVKALCSEADSLAEAGHLANALERLDQAMAPLPEPRHDWEAATWVLAAKADVLFLAQRWEASLDAVQEAIKFCPGGLENPFLHLRAGQSYMEIGALDTALQWLTTAWMAEGDPLFDGEDPKYLAFLRQHLKPPQGARE